MAAIPPCFGDLGKSARDLFEKEFGKITFAKENLQQVQYLVGVEYMIWLGQCCS